MREHVAIAGVGPQSRSTVVRSRGLRHDVILYKQSVAIVARSRGAQFAFNYEHQGREFSMRNSFNVRMQSRDWHNHTQSRGTFERSRGAPSTLCPWCKKSQRRAGCANTALLHVMCGVHVCGFASRRVSMSDMISTCV